MKRQTAPSLAATERAFWFLIASAVVMFVFTWTMGIANLWLNDRELTGLFTLDEDFRLNYLLYSFAASLVGTPCLFYMRDRLFAMITLLILVGSVATMYYVSPING